MARMRTVYNCSDCGAAHYKWAGKCDSCGAWNSLVEDVEDPAESVTLAAGMALVPPGTPQPLSTLSSATGKPTPTTIGELDRVLDGGLVPGSVTLLGGEPGIGKSTLLLQLLAAWPKKSLYVTAEESAQQVRLRAERLHALRDDVWLLSEASLTNIVAAIDSVAPTLIVIDSIQAVADPTLGSAPGSVVQVRLSARARSKESQHPRDPRRTRHERRWPRRSTCARTRRRHRALLRR
jgi:DNA repair protein RadA/Sms